MLTLAVSLEAAFLAEEELTYLLGRIHLITGKLGIPETHPLLALRRDTGVSPVCVLLDPVREAAG